MKSIISKKGNKHPKFKFEGNDNNSFNYYKRPKSVLSIFM